MSDQDDPYCPLPKESLFLNVANDRDKINYLIEKLQKNGEQLSQNYLQNKAKFFAPTVSVGCIASSIQQMMVGSVGRIILFAS